jgi:hypothetical protein
VADVVRAALRELAPSGRATSLVAAVTAAVLGAEEAIR